MDHGKVSMDYRWFSHDPDILALETTTLAPPLRTINEFISVSAGLRSEIASVTWRRRSFKANVSNGSCRGTTQESHQWSSLRKVSSSESRDPQDRSQQLKLAGNGSSVHSGVGLRPDPCGCVCLYSHHQKPTPLQNSFNPPSTTLSD